MYIWTPCIFLHFSQKQNDFRGVSQKDKNIYKKKSTCYILIYIYHVRYIIAFNNEKYRCVSARVVIFPIFFYLMTESLFLDGGVNCIVRKINVFSELAKSQNLKQRIIIFLFLFKGKSVSLKV